MDWRLWHVLSGLVIGAVLGFAIGSLGSDRLAPQASVTTQPSAISTTIAPGSPATEPAAVAPPGGEPGSAGPSTTSPPTTTTAPGAQPSSSGKGFGNGIFEIGTDVAPGKYKTAGPTSDSEFCFWSRLSGLNGDPDVDVIVNGAQDGPYTVTIEGSDVGFQSSSCQDWTPA